MPGDGSGIPILVRIDTGLRSAFGSSRSEAMDSSRSEAMPAIEAMPEVSSFGSEADAMPESEARPDVRIAMPDEVADASRILEAVRRLQVAEPSLGTRWK
eukprot:scaffold123609_cov45-Phaeocystis_antarctica.AAC.1